MPISDYIVAPFERAWTLLKQEKNFDFLGYSASQEPFGLVTFTAPNGTEKKVPFYRRSGSGSLNPFTGQAMYEEGEPKANQFVPFFGYDTEGHYGDSIQPYLIKSCNR